MVGFFAELSLEVGHVYCRKLNSKLPALSTMESPKSAEENEAKAPKPADNQKDNGESAAAADDVATQAREATEPEQGTEVEESPCKEGEKPISENTRRGKRTRKSAVIYTVEEKPQKEREIPDGKGEKLEQMPNVVDNFKAVTWSDPSLHDLYSIIFGQGKKKNFKEHLLQFNGVVYPEGKEETEKDKILAKMYKLKMDELKSAMDLADIDRTVQKGEKADKEELCRRFLAWLENPKASGKSAKKSSKKRGKRKSTSDKGSAKKARAANTPAKEKKILKTKKSAAKSTPKTPSKKASKPVQVKIAGVDIEKVRAKVKIIVENAEKADLTVKGVRKLLEDWLDTDLTDHKDVIRSLVMDVI